jgi:hypothetical protein
MKYYELVLENEQFMGVNAISVVENPAIEEEFVALSAQQVSFAIQNEEKRIIIGPVLIPNKPIYRRDDKTGEEYYVFFTDKTIRQSAELFLKKGLQASTTTEHSQQVNGVTTIEQWIIEDEVHDKSRKYGMNYPIGTWMQTRKVDNDQVWEDVKSGKYKGYSIEGWFAHKPSLEVAMSSMQEIEEQEAEHLVELYVLGAVKGILKKDKRVKAGQRVVMESYSDYPEAVRNNAKRGIELNEKGGNKCATPVGKIRAQQLADGKPVSFDTVKRMFSYLSRAEEYYDETDSTACGTISYLLWGGLAAKRWAESKIKENEKQS